ncbi:MAG: hypothetical protein ACI4PH_09140 [Faecousia sp.]
MEETQDPRLGRAADRLLVLLGQLLEELTPEQLDLRNVRSISSTLKDIRELQSRKDEDAGEITVVLEGAVQDYAK